MGKGWGSWQLWHFHSSCPAGEQLLPLAHTLTLHPEQNHILPLLQTSDTLEYWVRLYWVHFITLLPETFGGGRKTIRIISNKAVPLARVVSLLLVNMAPTIPFTSCIFILWGGVRYKPLERPELC